VTHKYKLSISPALEVNTASRVFKFNTLCELIAARQTAADILLFIQCDLKAMDPFSNCFISERWDDDYQEWMEID